VLVNWTYGEITKQLVTLGAIGLLTLQLARPAMASKLQALDASKFRLDGGLLIGRVLEVRGNVNFIFSLGQLRRSITPYLPPSVADALQAAGIPDTVEVDRARLFVDNLFVTWVPGSLRIRAGKQQLSWGPGYSYNPTDLFHRKTLVDPTYEKEGVTVDRSL
jgi:hypothetical protein